MASALHGLSHATLILQRGAGDTTGKDLALLIEELLQELGILVVDILNASLLEAAILFLLLIYRWGGKITDFALILCHDYASSAFCCLILRRFSAYCAAYFSILTVR